MLSRQKMPGTAVLSALIASASNVKLELAAAFLVSITPRISREALGFSAGSTSYSRMPSALMVLEPVSPAATAIDGMGQAIPSYAPKNSMAHFRKIECFCFTQHTLTAHEVKQYPVTFVVDADLPKDIPTITLSYTFFEVGLPGIKQAPQGTVSE